MDFKLDEPITLQAASVSRAPERTEEDARFASWIEQMRVLARTYRVV